jgi:acyl dehydratase
MSTVKLTSAPGAAGLYLKAAIGMTPLAGTRSKQLPDTVVALEAQPVDLDRLAAFGHVAAHTLTGSLPPIYFNVLSMPLQLKLMTGGGFPFPVIGLVHVRNRIDQIRSVDAAEPLALAVHAENLRAHNKGRQFDVISEARVGDELVARATSTYLKIGKGEPDAAAEEGEQIDFAALPQVAVWALPGDLGRRYAAVSGDRNPIHMHDLTAKALGFPKAIAHGMWTKARSLAAIDNKLPDAFTVDVAFKRPILLPAKVGFHVAETDGGLNFSVRNAKKGTPHLDGTTRAA